MIVGILTKRVSHSYGLPQMINFEVRALAAFFVFAYLAMNFGATSAASVVSMRGEQSIVPLSEVDMQDRAFQDRLIAYLYKDTGCQGENVFGLFEAAKSSGGCYNDFGGQSGFVGVKMQVRGQFFNGGGCSHASGHQPAVGSCDSFPKGESAITGIKIYR